MTNKTNCYLEDINIIYCLKEEGEELCNDTVLDFSEDESFSLYDIICEIDRELKRRGMTLSFIEEVNLVKIAETEKNDGLGYSCDNSIFISQKAFERGEGCVERLIVQELFLVQKYNCPEFKDKVSSISDSLEAKDFANAVLGTLEDIPNPEIIDAIRKSICFGAGLSSPQFEQY